MVLHAKLCDCVAEGEGLVVTLDADGEIVLLVE